MVEEFPVVSARITKPMRELIEEYLRRDSHVSESDLLRDAIRYYFETKHPNLVKKHMSPKKKDSKAE